MSQITINEANILGYKPLIVPSEILPIYKRAEQNDLDAIFDLSRHYFSFEQNTGQLMAALYYKSLLIDNYPKDYDPYACAVTMTDIAHVLGLLDKHEEANEWFGKTYKYVFANYPNDERRAVLEEIGFFVSLEEFELNLERIVVDST